MNKFNDLIPEPSDVFGNIEKIIEASLVLLGSDNEFFIEQAIDIAGIARDYASAAKYEQAKEIEE